MKLKTEANINTSYFDDVPVYLAVNNQTQRKEDFIRCTFSVLSKTVMSDAE